MPHYGWQMFEAPLFYVLTAAVGLRAYQVHFGQPRHLLWLRWLTLRLRHCAVEICLSALAAWWFPQTGGPADG